MRREIVIIDEELCDGCGLCVPACEEGALKIVNGKARLISDRLCDGLGACLGHCPQGAIRVEQCEAESFSESAVAVHLRGAGRQPEHTDREDQMSTPPGAFISAMKPNGGGCPGSRFSQFDRPAEAHADSEEASNDSSPSPQSMLTHWPVQLRLLSPMAPVLKGARLLLTADCVPVAFPDFHRRMLKGRAIALACPKLDETQSYVAKLSEMIRINQLKEIVVVHMEVPCCTGLMMLAVEARRLSKRPVPMRQIVLSLGGEILLEQEVVDGSSTTDDCCHQTVNEVQ